MSDKAPKRKAGESQPADIIDLAAFRRSRESSEYIEPSELSDAEMIEVFLSQLSHPSIRMRSSREVGDFVASLLSPVIDDEPTSQQIAWRQRMMGLMVDVDNLDIDQLDDWLARDKPLRAIYSALRQTKDDYEDKAAERVALKELRHLRGGVIHRQETNPYDDERWLQLTEKLAGLKL